MKKDSEMPTSRDIYPKLEELSPNWQSQTVDFLLREHWKKQGYDPDFDNNNHRCNEPQVSIKGRRIIFNLCSENHPRDFLTQLAIALIKSCRGKYDSLPGLHASDDDFAEHRSKRITTGQAEEAKALLKILAEYQLAPFNPK